MAGVSVRWEWGFLPVPRGGVIAESRLAGKWRLNICTVKWRLYLSGGSGDFYLSRGAGLYLSLVWRGNGDLIPVRWDGTVAVSWNETILPVEWDLYLSRGMRLIPVSWNETILPVEWDLVSDSYHLVSDSYRLVSDSYHLVSDSYHLVSDSYHLVSDSYHLVGDSYLPEPNTAIVKIHCFATKAWRGSCSVGSF